MGRFNNGLRGEGRMGEEGENKKKKEEYANKASSTINETIN